MNTASTQLLLIDGKSAAERVIEESARDVAELSRQGYTPGLAVVLVGDDPASHVYVRNKVKTAHRIGMKSFQHQLSAESTQQQVLQTIHELNDNPEVHGILVQLPLPDHIDEAAIINAIDPDKDVDGFHRINVGRLVLAEEGVLAPCTPSGCMRLLRDTCPDLSGKHAVVIGRSNIVGKPMASLLLQANCSVTILHSRSHNAKEICRQADIVIVAVGRPQMVDASWLKKGAIVIDVGINRIEDKVDGRPRLVGDVDFASASDVAAAITPVPGGVGPMTIAFLMSNTIAAAKRKHAAASHHPSTSQAPAFL
ncbi:MAG: bifunctional methylenetetrahydrofolate dehydrogenase/methenyltetrahydrofolate cyclohydrolase FolD [Candidatus Pseudomonas phytovorans]|uniref:Bifunctional protein FolD n=1 Tax=Candidatus Pseudomonas phytovorans TaxID=3121377 RepID=A0AAJ6BEH5_9PSED|nr:bifunctional methylenetetrahydrofolate dehydrogenase/methenyltetrahydrofolate cyclohydrolase FolD [Pseudomonas sp.]WEK32749.1 MAG: bifunctional methylenetetrahydrofolate dehydrogenase/methenyltetrahydrofolate cyclohydrolase FolD [Pseudomonas sp.]